MPQSRKQPAHRRVEGQQTTVTKRQAKVAVTLRVDRDLARRLQAAAAVSNRSLTDYSVAVLLCALTRQEAAEHVITMYLAPGVSDSIRPEDVIRAEDESDEDYAARQKLATDLWSIPDNAGGGLGFLAGEPDLYNDEDLIERYR